MRFLEKYLDDIDYIVKYKPLDFNIRSTHISNKISREEILNKNIWTRTIRKL